MSAAFTRAGEDGRLTLAVPAKGRMAEAALRLCADAGLSFEVTERSLVVPCANAPVDLLLVRPSDIPEYAQDGVVDVGITGANLVARLQEQHRVGERVQTGDGLDGLPGLPGGDRSGCHRTMLA